MTLPKRQQDVLDFLVAYIRDHGYAPSIEEIGANLGMKSTSTVAYHLDALTKKGFVTRRGPRSFDLAADVQKIGVPYLGRIVAGNPVTAVAEAIESADHVDVASLFHLPDHYLLEVTGLSMVEEQIAPGDKVLVRPTNTARNGDLVVALVDGEETTLKRYYLEGDTVRLQPANSEMEPIIVERQRVAIQGKVAALFRTYALR